MNERARARLGVNLRDKYRLERLLGVGGTAAVYAATHRNGHPVAIKLLHEPLPSDPAVAELFHREAKISNRLKHDAIVPVRDDDVAEDGCAFLVMPLVEGETLRARAARRGGCLPLEEVISAALGILDALAAAHAQNIIHCDIKPENVMVTATGQVRILDFGIARFLASDSLTTTDHPRGTPAYMAPEQALGRQRYIDTRTDTWAVGALMFSLLTGASVHAGSTRTDTLLLAAAWAAPAIRSVQPDVPEAVAAVIDRALARDAHARWDSARAMFDALGAAGASSDTSATVATTVRPPKSRGSTGMVVGAAVLALLAFGAVAGLRFAGRGIPSATALAATAPSNVPPNAEAIALLEGARQLWRDGSVVAARERFAAAAKADANFTAAHLLYVAASEWTDPSVREHLRLATQLRSKLSSADRVFLEALSPATMNVDETSVTIERLGAARANDPTNVELESALVTRLVHARRYEEGLRAARALAKHSNLGNYLAARIFAETDRLDLARETLGECIGHVPGAGDCLELSILIAMNEGDCILAEQQSRQFIDAVPEDADRYLYLASALAGQRRPPSQVLATLEQRWGRIAAADRPLHQCRDEGQVFAMRGMFEEANAALLRCETAAPTNTDAYEQGMPRDRRWVVARETGHRARMMEIAQEYANASAAWSSNEFLDARIEGPQLLRMSGVMNARDFGTVRDRWLSEPISREHYYGRNALRWYEAFAFPAVTSEEAKLAIARMPTERPLFAAYLREPQVDEALGEMYLRAGDHNAALPFLRRASNACSLASIVSVVRSQYLLGTAYENLGNREAACVEYDRVLSMWSEASGSVSARESARRRSLLRCSTVTSKEGKAG